MQKGRWLPPYDHQIKQAQPMMRAVDPRQIRFKPRTVNTSFHLSSSLQNKHRNDILITERSS